MNRLEQVERVLMEEFDAYIVVGSMYDPESGNTTMNTMRHGNGYAIEGMLDELAKDMEYAEEEEDG